VRQEILADFYQNLSFGVNLVLEGSHQFLKGPEANDLDTLVGVTETGLDLLQAILPLALGIISLRNVINYIFELGSKKAQKMSLLDTYEIYLV
jgi:hypothetical protein